MSVLGRVLMLCLIAGLSLTASADSEGVTDTRESVYDSVEVEEVMTAGITQMGENIIGAYIMHPEPESDDHSGIIYGTIEGDHIKAYYISNEGSGGVMMVTFTDGDLIDENTIEGTYYCIDGNMAEMSGDYKATRIDD